ncbi:DUF4870 domain-containing protein [Leptothoe spongobia]|uniref:DUF4870 domain-containing protein n=1 Tax=Leptothoe spongobia TAU-MAC 1115 TaxID=1967444 RepID=A0A947DIC0_9CYAN|nr:DUF4870 domain-containing protein [Leptothoe spongobia]MBT9317193.1 DUF4870 domain-containing protein [Leptothoe spongobia TAU-MAC 1115]
MSHAKETPSGAFLLHLSLLLGWLVPIPFIDIMLPIIIWQTTKKQSPQIEPHARNAINWLISSTVYSVVLMITLVGTVLLPVLWGLRLIFPIIAAIQASKGKVWKYPLTIDFLGARADKQLQRAAIGFLSLVVIPLSALLGSLVWRHRHVNWLASLSPATGTVTQVLEKTGDDGDTLYKPVIKFKVPQQESYEVSSLGWSDYITYKKGASVEVLYSPSDPANAIIDQWFEKWFLITLALVTSGVLLSFSIIPSIFCLVFSRFV